MLTEIFSTRYSSARIWDEFGERERRLLVQSFRLLVEQVCPYWVDEKESAYGKSFWTDIHSKLSMELGLTSLSPLACSYNTEWMGKTHTVSGVWTIDKVCETWMLHPFDGKVSADQFIKERLSLVELGLRKRWEDVSAENVSLAQRAQESRLRAARKGPRIKVPGDPAEWLIEDNRRKNQKFQEVAAEFNARLHQAQCNLNYHNGFIQRSDDALVGSIVEEPFWQLVAASKWKNVDLDIKEAIDRRDAGSRDPAFYAARALESTIKIISASRNLTTGKEKGAHNFIDNLASKNSRIIAAWESETLKSFFTNVRNPLGHGPGEGDMILLDAHQTNWAIEFCMIWIKSLVCRT